VTGASGNGIGEGVKGRARVALSLRDKEWRRFGAVSAPFRRRFGAGSDAMASSGGGNGAPAAFFGADVRPTRP
jgi:hypothetical protein